MFVGIDVAKAELMISSVPADERWTVANDERGGRTLHAEVAHDFEHHGLHGSAMVTGARVRDRLTCKTVANAAGSED